MEDTILSFTDEVVLFSNYEEDDLIGLYISNIFTFYIQEMVICDINENGFNEELFDLIGNIDVSLPDEIIDYYRDVVNPNEMYIPEEKKMIPLKMNKSTVHKLIMDNMNWFEDKDNKTCWLSCSELEEKINQYFQKKAAATNKVFMTKASLNSSTLTALVLDRVLERTFSESKKCYLYCPTLHLMND